MMSQREPEQGPRDPQGSYESASGVPEPRDPEISLGPEVSLGPEEPTVARPERPGMARTPAPASALRARPGMLTTVMGLLYGGVGVGLVGVISAFLWRSGSRARLLEAMAGSTADLASKQRAADIVLYGSIGALALLLIVELALASRLGAGRPGARPALTIIVPAHLVLLFLVRDVVTSQGWQGTLIEASLIIQAAVLVVVVVLSWSPPMGRWLRRRPAGPSSG